MSRLVLVASLVAAVALAACANAIVEPSRSPAATPAIPSVPPSAARPTAPPPSATPPPAATPLPATPAPTARPPVATPRPATLAPPSHSFTAAEKYLLAGVRRGATNCKPASGREDLPARALAGIECASPDRAVARVGFYVFPSDEAMLDAYLARMAAEGVELDSGSCHEGESEHAYTPGEGLLLDRAGCFINSAGFANYRATLAGPHVYIGILGRSDNMQALEDFAWRGNQDTPGNPTLWFPPS